MTNHVLPEIVICKWNPKPIRLLLKAGRRVHLILDTWDKQFGGITADDLEGLASIHVVESFDALPEMYGVAASLRDLGVKEPLVGSFAEFSQFGAGVLGDLLGSPNQSLELSLRSRDKRAMKQAYVDGGVHCARWMSVPDLAQLPTDGAITEVVGWPAVLKPVSGMGAIGTATVDDYRALGACANQTVLPPEVACHQFMLEEHIDGVEYHVDAVWDAGAAWYFSIAEYVRPRLQIKAGEEGSVLLNKDEHEDFYRQVHRLHEDVNRAMGISDGATHFEFFRRPNGSLVASEFATRIGGGPVVDMIAGRDGFDLRELWAAQLGGLEQPVVETGSGSPYRHVASINIPPDGEGTVIALPELSALESDPHVLSWLPLVSVGEAAHGPWSMFLVLGADTEQELAEVIARSRGTYRVMTGG